MRILHVMGENYKHVNFAKDHWTNHKVILASQNDFLKIEKIDIEKVYDLVIFNGVPNDFIFFLRSFNIPIFTIEDAKNHISYKDWLGNEYTSAEQVINRVLKIKNKTESEINNFITELNENIKLLLIK